ncbi:MAG: hypothetical protein Q8873_00900 [Bacillota bacterium]|nr:hypothetical protein [Bacillota bacterium]
MKRLFALATVVCLLTFLFEGCGGNPQNSQNPSNGNGANNLTAKQLAENFKNTAGGNWHYIMDENGIALKLNVSFSDGKFIMSTEFANEQTKELFRSQGYSDKELEDMLAKTSHEANYTVTGMDDVGVYTVEIDGDKNYVLVKDNTLYMGTHRPDFPQNADLVLTRG